MAASDLLNHIYEHWIEYTTAALAGGSSAFGVKRITDAKQDQKIKALEQAILDLKLLSPMAAKDIQAKNLEQDKRLNSLLESNLTITNSITRLEEALKANSERDLAHRQEIRNSILDIKSSIAMMIEDNRVTRKEIIELYKQK